MKNDIVIFSVEAGMGTVKPTIYGQFIEHIMNCINGGIYDPGHRLSDESGIRTDVLEKAKALAPSVLRFPGGTIMCQYHWEDAIGPKEKRILRKNLIWGGELDPSFGTAEFISFCRRLGAEPMLCINMVSGTPEEAGNWVEYCNGTGNSYYAQLRRNHGYANPFGVKYWCIGNESYAEPDPGVHHNVSLYIRDALEFIKVMKLTDPTIQTILVGCDKPEWNKAVLDALHPFGDYLSLHHYSAENQKGLYGPFESEKALIQMIEDTQALIDTYPDRIENFNPWYRFPPRNDKLKIALDEWNIWDYVADNTYGLHPTYNWRDAVWVASALCDIITHPSVEIANMAQLVNVLAPIVADQKGSYYQTIAYPLMLFRTYMIGERMTLRWEPIYFHGGKAGPLEVLRCCAVRAEDGKLRVIAVNRDFSNTYTLRLRDCETTSITLSADSPTEVCSRERCCVHWEEKKVSCNEILLPPGGIVLLCNVILPE